MNRRLDLNCVDCKSRPRGVFCTLKQDSLVHLSSQKTSNRYQPGQIIFYEGNQPFGLFCLNSGKVKVYKTGVEGKQTIVRLAGAGDILGYRSFFSKGAYMATAEVIEEAQVCFISRDTILEVLRRDPGAAMNLIGYLSSALGAVEDRLRDFAQKNVRERVAGLLLSLRTADEPNAVRFEIPLSRQDMAEMIGTTPESVVRILTEFKQEGLISLNGRRLELLNEDKILASAGLDW